MSTCQLVTLRIYKRWCCFKVQDKNLWFLFMRFFLKLFLSFSVLGVNMESSASHGQVMGYNQAFFGLWEQIFLELKSSYGKEETLNFCKHVMEKSLAKAYDSTGFKKGSPNEFARVLKLRDNAVGLDVDFPKVTDNEIIYQFKTDPFPNIKSQFTTDEVYSTFIPFKIHYILGENWGYKITKDMWKKDTFTEITIFRLSK